MTVEISKDAPFMSVFQRETRVVEVDRASARAIMRETRVVEVDRASARAIMPETRVVEVDGPLARAIMRETQVVEVDRATARVITRGIVRDQEATVMEGVTTALTGGRLHDNIAKEWTLSP